MSRSAELIPFRPRGSEQATEEPARAPRERPRGLPPAPGQPTRTQHVWLARGLDQPGGKLPLFNVDGSRVDPKTIRACLAQGWVAPWFDNPLKPGWLVCRLTDAGRAILAGT